MNSKPFILLGLLFAIVVLCSMDVNTVTARDVNFKEAIMETDELDDDVNRHGYGGGHARILQQCLHGCNTGCCSCVRGRCVRCC
ncbi:hypothetical protein IC582_000522 [Cucumis melo]